MNQRTFASQIDDIHDRAIKFMGSDYFGDDDDYVKNLRYLLDCADRVNNWTELGRQALPQKIAGTLCSRLSFQQGIRQFPDCLNQPIEKPIIVTGVRSGTTVLHRLLAIVPKTQAPEFWLTCYPQPRPPRDTWNSNPMFQRAVNLLEEFNQVAPSLRASHSFEADAADENHQLVYSFGYLGSLQVLWDPIFLDRIFGNDHRQDYANMKKTLQLIGYCNRNKWVMKCPLHMARIEETLELFPDVTIVNTHRDPVVVLPSLCSVLYAMISPFQNIPKTVFGREMIKFWGDIFNKYAKSRAMLDSKQFMDVDYNDIVADPLGTVAKIYTKCDGDFSAESAAKVAAWHASHPQHKHGKHYYTGEEFGLSEGLIREHTAQFCDYFSYRS